MLGWPNIHQKYQELRNYDDKSLGEQTNLGFNK